MMPVVRISLGRFDAANYDAIRKLLDDSQKALVPATRALKVNRAYYVGIDPENNAMTNVSVWDTRAEAERMATLQPMLDLAKIFVKPGYVSKDRSPTTRRSGRCNFVGLWPSSSILSEYRVR